MSGGSGPKRLHRHEDRRQQPLSRHAVPGLDGQPEEDRCIVVGKRRGICIRAQFAFINGALQPLHQQGSAPAAVVREKWSCAAASFCSAGARPT